MDISHTALEDIVVKHLTRVGRCFWKDEVVFRIERLISSGTLCLTTLAKQIGNFLPLGERHTTVYLLLKNIYSEAEHRGTYWIKLSGHGTVIEPYTVMDFGNDVPEGSWGGPFHCVECAIMCASYGLTEDDSFKWNHGTDVDRSYIFMRE